MHIENGSFVFDNIEELNYNFLNAMGCAALPDGKVIDTELQKPVQYGGMTLKANTNVYNIHYAGEGEIMLDVLNDIKGCSLLLGHLLDKLRVFDNRDILSHYMEDNEDADGNRLIRQNIKFTDSEIIGKYYHNKCLSIIDSIFQLADMDVNLNNFDKDFLDQLLEKKGEK